MPDKEKFHTILDKVRKTFGILREMFSETPLEPEGKPRELSQERLSDQANPTILDRVESVADPVGKVQTDLGTAVRESPSLPEALQRYLENILSTYEYVPLPGFQTGSQTLNVPLEKLYVPLTFMDKRLGVIRPERDDGFYGGAAALSLASTLQRYRRLVIIGGAGCGKTSLLVTTLLAYARALGGERLRLSSVQANPTNIKFVPLSRQRFHVAEDAHLPVLLSLRELGQYLKARYRRSVKDSPDRLLNYLRESLLAQESSLPEDFFETYLVSGKAVVLMDGLDEVDVPSLRQRVVRLIEKFVKYYPGCRYVITSRPLGGEGVALLGEQFGTLQIRAFNLSETRQFVRAWSLSLETSLALSEAPDVLALAKQRAEKLVSAIDDNPRLAELAISPLALIMLAFIQRNRAQWPECRADLYEMTFGVLLNRWETVDRPEQVTATNARQRNLDRVERRQALEMIAFWLQQNDQSEIKRADLNTLLQPWFLHRHNGDETLAAGALESFLQLAAKDNGLFIERRSDLFGFVQRTFQEYLAAQALTERNDTLAYTRKCLSVSWWREVILFESGILNRQAKHRLSELIRFILEAGSQSGLQPYDFSFLAAECLLDVNLQRLDPGLQVEVEKSLKKLVNAPLQQSDRQGLLNKLTASNALAGLQGGQAPARFWKLPYGEPEWVNIPAGEFWMGEAGDGPNLMHRVSLPEYQISRVPVTNAQYALYLMASDAEPPDHWRSRQAPRGRENHPVVNVNWHEALAYCTWLAGKINQPVCLPSEAEWEQAARGSQDQREYPWGTWDELRANTSELGLGDTTPVGLFPQGASPFGLLDMTGNVREWTRSLSDFGYPYDPAEKPREDLQALDDQPRVLRGGSFYYTRDYAPCAYRQRYYPDFRFYNFGFRVVISPSFS